MKRGVLVVAALAILAVWLSYLPEVEVTGGYEAEGRMFRNIEDMIRFQTERLRLANAALLPEQQQIAYGSYAVKIFWEAGNTTWIFLKVLTLEELMKGEDPHIRTHYERRYERGLRHGEHYSVITPDGEWGSSHVISMWPITEEQYREAEENGWDPSDAFKKQIEAEIARSRHQALDKERHGATRIDPGEQRSHRSVDGGEEAAPT